MLRALLCLAILVLMTAPLSSDVKCQRAYVTFMEDSGHSQVDGTRLALLHRTALRIFNACDSGHLENPEAYFRKLEKSSLPGP